MKKLLFILLTVLIALGAYCQTKYKLPYDTVIVKKPSGVGYLDAAKGIFSDTLFLSKLQYRDGNQANGYVMTSDANGNISLQPASGGGGTPAGNTGNVQLNRNGVFATPASDSLNYDANGLVDLGNLRVGRPFTASTAKVQITNDGTEPFLNVGPPNYSNPNNYWVNFQVIDSNVTTNTGMKVVGNRFQRQTIMGANGITLAFRYGGTLGWQLYTKDSVILSSQNNDASSASILGMEFDKAAGQTTRSVVKSGNVAFDHSSAALVETSAIGGSAGNNFKLRGYYAGVIAYPLTNNAALTDSMENYSGFVAGGAGITNGFIFDNYRAFVATAAGGTGANILGKYMSFYGLNGSSKTAHFFNQGDMRLGGTSLTDDTATYGRLQVDGLISMRDGNQAAGKMIIGDANGLFHWVDTTGLFAYTADNGITLSAHNFKWGGTLIQSTTINASLHDILFDSVASELHNYITNNSNPYSYTYFAAGSLGLNGNPRPGSDTIVSIIVNNGAAAVNNYADIISRSISYINQVRTDLTGIKLTSTQPSVFNRLGVYYDSISLSREVSGGYNDLTLYFHKLADGSAFNKILMYNATTGQVGSGTGSSLFWPTSGTFSLTNTVTGNNGNHDFILAGTNYRFYLSDTAGFSSIAGNGTTEKTVILNHSSNAVISWLNQAETRRNYLLIDSTGASMVLDPGKIFRGNIDDSTYYQGNSYVQRDWVLDHIAAAGGGSSLFPVTGTGTATGNITGDLGVYGLYISGADGPSSASFSMSGIDADGAGFGMSATDGTSNYTFAMNFDGGFKFINFNGTDQATVYMRPYGWEYAADYSASWTDRYLVDKGYVDAAIAAVSGWGLSGNSLSGDGTLGATNAHGLSIVTNNVNKINIPSGTAQTGNITFGSDYASSIGKYIFKYKGDEASGARGIDMYDVANGYHVVLQGLASGTLYITNESGTAGALTVATISNPADGSTFTNAFGTWTISAGRLGVGGTANASAILDAASTTKGFAPPRMTTTQKNAISSPVEGLVVYDLTLHKLCIFTGSVWETITSL